MDGHRIALLQEITKIISMIFIRNAQCPFMNMIYSMIYGSIIKEGIMMEDGVMMNGFDDDEDFQSLHSNAISCVVSLCHMQYQRKDRKRKCSGSNKRTRTCQA